MLPYWLLLLQSSDDVTAAGTGAVVLDAPPTFPFHRFLPLVLASNPEYQNAAIAIETPVTPETPTTDLTDLIENETLWSLGGIGSSGVGVLMKRRKPRRRR